MKNKCPHCGSIHTKFYETFGLHYCLDCKKSWSMETKQEEAVPKSDTSFLNSLPKGKKCPLCGSIHTKFYDTFGSHYCLDCKKSWGRQKEGIIIDNKNKTIDNMLQSDYFEISKKYHKKKDINIWIVKLNNKVDTDSFEELRLMAKQNGGYYSSYRGVNGFVFYSDNDARSFGEEIEQLLSEVSFGTNYEEQDDYYIDGKTKNTSKHSSNKEAVDLINDNVSTLFSMNNVPSINMAQMEMHEAIKQIVAYEGKNIVKDIRFVNILSDFQMFAGRQSTKYILRSIIEGGYSAKLLSIGEWNFKCNQLINKFVTDTGFQKDIAEDLFKKIVYALGWNDSILDNLSEDSSSGISPNINTILNEELRNKLVIDTTFFDDNYINVTFNFKYDNIKKLLSIDSKFQGFYKEYIQFDCIIYGSNNNVLYKGTLINFDSPSYLDGEISNCSCIQGIYKNKINKIVVRNVEKVIEEEEGYNVDEYGAKYTKDWTKLIRIPSNLRNYEIKNDTKIICENAFEYSYSIESVIIPDGVECIGNNAFRGCRSLKYIMIPQSVKRIGIGVFSGCSSFLNIKIQTDSYYIKNKILFSKQGRVLDCFSNAVKINLPQNTTYIGEYAFSSCEELKYINIPDGVVSIGRGAFYNCKNIEQIKFPDSLKRIGGNAFHGCISIRRIIIPGNVKSIGEYAFEGCEHLEYVYISNGVELIGACAFKSCSFLEILNIPISVNSIGGGVLNGCKSLFRLENCNKKYYEHDSMLYSSSGEILSCWSESYDIIIQDNIIGISDYAFHDCSLIFSIYIPDSIRYIGKNAFDGCSMLNTIYMHDGVDTIRENAFNWCSSLKSIDIPNSVTTIGNYAFAHCLNLEYVNLSNNLKELGFSAFDGCSSLHSIEIPNGITIISDGLFQDCNSLESIQVPDSVIRIDCEAFWDCSSLTDIILPKSIEKIGISAFRGCSSLKSINIPLKTKIIGGGCFSGCISLNNVIVDNEYFIVKDKMLLSINGELISYWSEEVNAKIPNYVNKIGDFSFIDSNIKSIVIPETVTHIGKCAFWGCTKLNSIFLHDNIISIDQSAFINYDSLKIFIPKGSRKKFTKLVNEYIKTSLVEK